jgi:hypothetical protein
MFDWSPTGGPSFAATVGDEGAPGLWERMDEDSELVDILFHMAMGGLYS